MLAEAMCIVKYPDQYAYIHRHNWYTDSFDTALIELIEWRAKTEQEQRCTINVQTLVIIMHKEHLQQISEHDGKGS